MNYYPGMGVSQLVAPSAGAWIETRAGQRGKTGAPVAPSAGAWIETRPQSGPTYSRAVAPSAGAWIETASSLIPFCRGVRRALRGRVD